LQVPNVAALSVPPRNARRFIIPATPTKANLCEF
jgi:hypothetical protein